MELWDKFVVLRRDGSVPDWPYFVLGARDPAAPAALRAYADEAEQLGMDPGYVAGLRGQAGGFEAYRLANRDGDPAPHRTDDPVIVSLIKAGSRRIAG